MTVILPITPNWSTAYEETLQFKTDIFTSRSGVEQRRSLRSVERRLLEFTGMLSDNTERRALRRVLDTQQDKPLFLVDPLRNLHLSAAALAGDTALFVSHVPDWLVTNALLYAAGVEMVVISVDAVSGRIGLLSQLQGPLPVGALVSVLTTVLLNNPVSPNNVTSVASTVDIGARVVPGTETAGLGGIGLDTAAGYEVLITRENWLNPVVDDITWQAEVIDFDFGLIEIDQVLSGAGDVRHLEFLCDAHEAERFKQFFRRCRGQRGAFIVPTWQDDLPLVNDIGAGETYILVDGAGTVDYQGHVVFQHICIATKDGRRIYRKIVDMDDVSTSLRDTTAVYIDAPLMTHIRVDEVRSISWAPLCRFATDELLVVWQTSNVATLATAIQTLYWKLADIAPIANDPAITFMLEILPDNTDFFDRFDYEIKFYGGIFNR